MSTRARGACAGNVGTEGLDGADDETLAAALMVILDEAAATVPVPVLLFDCSIARVSASQHCNIRQVNTTNAENKT